VDRVTRALSALILLLLAAGPAQAAAIIERLPATEPLLKNPYFDVLVVSIIEAGSTHATHRDPPRGRITVEEVLRGRIPLGTHAALWEAPMRGDDYVREPDGTIRMKPEWYERPLPPPAAGERVIVFGNVVPSHPYRVLGWAVYRASADNLDVARRHAAPAERAGWLQLPLFLAIVAAPVAGIVLAVRGRRRRWIYGLALAAAGAYAVYESGISSYTNIRVDLLVVFPALAIMALVVIVTPIVDLIRGRGGRGPRRTAGQTRSS
jgi:hypothetical protein